MMQIQPQLEAEVFKTCESIGFADEGKGYVAEPDWEVCVKDLIKYLRRDDDDHSIRRLLGQAQVVGRDLLPLFKHYSKEAKVWQVALRLLVNLTHPALLLYDEEIPKNKKYLNYYNQLEQYLRMYKEAFVDKGVWKTLADKLRQLLDLEWDKRMEEDKLTIERILILVRNILHVPADPTEERRADDDTSLHDRILMVMHLSGFFDLLLFTASSDSTQEYAILVLEIMSVMLREQTGEQLARTQLARNEDDKVKDEKELIRIREKEIVLKSIQLQKLPSRHSRFGGTFVVRDMKAPSGRDILCHKPITSAADLSLDSQKKRKKVASNRKPINEEDATRRSTLPIRIILKDFSAGFVSKKYNQLMSIVKDNINRGRVEDNDETYYLWALKFFMEFNRHHQFGLRHVRETVSTNTFHYVQTLLDRYQGMMVTDKEKIPFWSRRTHMALKAYQELLFTLVAMDKDGDESVQDESRAIKSNVFYLPEYRELCLGLLSTYDPVKLSKLYLKDLIETNHLFLKMLEDYSTRNRRVLIKCKGKKQRSKKAVISKKKEKKDPRRGKNAATMSPSELEESWAIISGEISTALSSSGLPDEDERVTVSSTNANVVPFDAASDVPIDEQKGTAVQRIAVFLHSGKSKEATLLLRASREVWPTHPEYFGDVDCEPSDEVDILKSIYMEKASLPAVTEARLSAQNEESQETGELSSRTGPVDENDGERAAVIGQDDGNDEEKDEEDEEDEEEEEEERVEEREQEFDFRGFVLKYAMARVVANYAFLFNDWDTLKPLTLHCIMKMFHRFVFDMGYPALVCQASLFLTFQKVLQVADHRSDLKEVKTFFLHFWPKFAKLCNDKKMFVEILFWKTAREAQEIQDGYADLQGGGGGKSKKSDWTKDEETELELLVELYQDSPEEVKRAQKLIDFIMERWTWKSRSKRMFINKLTEKELVDPTEFSKKERPPKTWAEQEVSQLRELYEEHKDSEDIMGKLLEKMEVKRSRKAVVQKMIEIGLINDKNEVKKKGRRSKKNVQSCSQVSRDSDSENDGERDEGRRRTVSDSGSSSDSDSEKDGSTDDERNDEPVNIGPYDEEQCFELGKKLMEKEMGVAVRWLRQSLEYYLEDIMDDPDSDESVPLVPIDSDCILAVSDMDFKMFLKSLGIQPPGQGETYWRIPSSLKKRQVEFRLDSLEKVLEWESAGSNLSGPSAVANLNENSNESSAISQPKKKPRKRLLSELDSDSDDSSVIQRTVRKSSSPTPGTTEENKESESVVQSQAKRKLSGRSRLDSSSSSSSSGSSGSSVSGSVLSSVVPKPPASEVSAVNSSVVGGVEDEENGEKLSQASSSTTDGRKRKKASSNANSSDSEEENIGMVVRKKRAVIIDSDDDD